MIEKVNPKHPDKVADRVAGAIVDYAYLLSDTPKIAVEILLGHGKLYAIIETDVAIVEIEILKIINRIVGNITSELIIVPQDKYLNNNQKELLRCGDNGIFKGVPLTDEEKELSAIARKMYKEHPSDGKYILSNGDLTICQSYATEIKVDKYDKAIVNPLGYWTGGIDVDSGATNRKLGSDLAGSITGGGIHGKDLSKADVSINVYAFLKAQQQQQTVELHCSIGDEYVNGIPFKEIVSIAKEYVSELGGFEKLAEWGVF